MKMAPQQQGLSAFLKGSSANRHLSTPAYETRFHFHKRQNRRDDSSRFGKCPMCESNFPWHVLEAHAESCEGRNEYPMEEAKLKQKNSVGSVGGCKEQSGNCPICNILLPIPLLVSHAQVCVAKDENGKAAANIPSIPPDESKGKRKASTSRYSKFETTKASPSATSNNSTTIPWWKQAKRGKMCIDNPILPSSEPMPGLFLFENFITEQEEADILAELDGTSAEYRHEFLPWKQSKFNGSNMGKRWGLHCNLRDRRVTTAENPMPHFFHAILQERLHRVVAMSGCVPNEANAIDYHRKQGHWLQSHVDDRQLSKEPIANLSAAGDCYMTFRNERVPTAGKEKRVLLRRRTLQVLTGKARYDFAHGIHNDDLLSDRRVSITMRESPLTKRV